MRLKCLQEGQWLASCLLLLHCPLLLALCLQTAAGTGDGKHV
jgi:hypothetical protein